MKSILFNMIMETYLNRQWKCVHAAASRAKFISSAHSLKSGFNELTKQNVHIKIR